MFSHCRSARRPQHTFLSEGHFKTLTAICLPWIRLITLIMCDSPDLTAQIQWCTHKQRTTSDLKRWTAEWIFSLDNSCVSDMEAQVNGGQEQLFWPCWKTLCWAKERINQTPLSDTDLCSTTLPWGHDLWHTLIAADTCPCQGLHWPHSQWQ